MRILAVALGASQTSSLKPQRRGQTLLEFALVMPILVLLILSVYEFAFYERDQLRIVNATREGARYAAMGASDTAVKQRVEHLALPLTVTDSEITLKYASYDSSNGAVGGDLDWPANTTASPPANGVAPGNLIRVIVAVPRTPVAVLPFMSNTVVNANTTMMRTQNSFVP